MGIDASDHERRTAGRRPHMVGGLALAFIVIVLIAAVPMNTGAQGSAVRANLGAALGRAAGAQPEVARIPGEGAPVPAAPAKPEPRDKQAAPPPATKPSPPPAAAPAAPSRQRSASRAPVSPVAGKGMWIWQYGRIAGGDHETIVRHAVNLKLTHVYVRVGSGRSGLDTLAEVAPLIPVAHRSGIKVIAWYFPYYNPLESDVARSVQAMNLRVQGQGFDGFAADIEPARGSNLSAQTASEYSRKLRAALPGAYLIAVPPRPTATTIRNFPYDAVMPHYDAIAPMVYWGKYDPSGTVIEAIEYLARYGKHLAPIGQTYDMGPEGGPKGNPPPHQTWAFMRTAKQRGAIGVSFWSWQHATSPEFDAIRHFVW